MTRISDILHKFKLLYQLDAVNQAQSAFIYHDPEEATSRYIVLFYCSTGHLQDQDYHTNDLIDAWNTAALKLVPRP